ncbi:MAG: NAD(+)/NADH kinase [Mariprofundus sp.]|nr:NAD(+)/NADH kinase [Mariprofundus sp.]
MKRIGISIKPHDKRACVVLNELHVWLLDKGCEVFVDNAVEHGLDLDASCLSLPLSQMVGRIELMVVLGGDGTLLHAARQFIGSETPILGINLGRLGFLTDTPVGSMFETMQDVLAGNLKTKVHFSLSAEVWRQDTLLASGSAMNDVVIERSVHPRMIGFEMWVKNQLVFRMRGDGLVLATPAGSTAYALSAGGPIVHPSVNAISVVPVCPHTLSNRPILVPADDDIELNLVESKLCAGLSLDGQELIALQEGDRVVVRKGAGISLVYLPDRHYYETLRSKLNWVGQAEAN